MLPLVGQLGNMLDAHDEALPFDLGRAWGDAQRGEDLEIGPKGRGEIRVGPQLCEEATPQFTGDPVSGRKVVGSFVAARVADDDVLVIGEGPDVGFPGWVTPPRKARSSHGFSLTRDSTNRRSRQRSRHRGRSS